MGRERDREKKREERIEYDDTFGVKKTQTTFLWRTLF